MLGVIPNMLMFISNCRSFLGYEDNPFLLFIRIILMVFVALRNELYHAFLNLVSKETAIFYIKQRQYVKSLSDQTGIRNNFMRAQIRIIIWYKFLQCKLYKKE